MAFRSLLAAASLLLTRAVPLAHAWKDCDGTFGAGDFSAAPLLNVTWDGTMFYVLVPSGVAALGDAPAELPAIVFMHGSTGQYEMYEQNLQLYASHGFVVVFPFVKDPEKDKSRRTTNNDGEFMIRGVHYLQNATKDVQSPLFGRVDTSNIILNGHSMGATCTIAAAKRLPAGSVRAAVAQHPGICGPFGPPPLPSTWMPKDLAEAASKMPILLTTATNDGAFWPAPHTAQHEIGCFGKVSPAMPGTGIVEFSADACSEDGQSTPWTDAGHNCPFKPAAETPWVLTMARLYAQMGGNRTSRCHALLWGSGADSLRNSPTAAKAVLNEPAVEEASVLVV